MPVDPEISVKIEEQVTLICRILTASYEEEISKFSDFDSFQNDKRKVSKAASLTQQF